MNGDDDIKQRRCQATTMPSIAPMILRSVDRGEHDPQRLPLVNGQPLTVRPLEPLGKRGNYRRGTLNPNPRRAPCLKVDRAFFVSLSAKLTTSSAFMVLAPPGC